VPLSPHWQDASAPVRRTRNWLPVWAVGAVAAVLMVMAFALLSFNLARPPPTAPSRPSTRCGCRRPRAPWSCAAQRQPRLQRFLEPEIRDGLLTVRDEADRSVVVLRGDGLFASGSDRVLDRYAPVLARVADALNSVEGNVLVSGFSDDQPIRSVRFPSNWQLSQARADAVKKMISQRIDTARAPARRRPRRRRPAGAQRLGGQSRAQPARGSDVAGGAGRLRARGFARAARRRCPLMLRAIFRFLISRDLWVFLGLVAVAFLIWIIGPAVAVGRYRPLEDEVVRIVVIVADVRDLARAASMYRKWRERRLNAQLLNQLRTPSKKEKEAKPEDAPEIKELQSGFTDATAILKNMRFERRGYRRQRPRAASRCSTGSTFTSCPGISSSARRARARPRRWSTPTSTFRWPTSSARPRCAASAARATATGGSPTRRC
jgi:hypothetical protein